MAKENLSVEKLQDEMNHLTVNEQAKNLLGSFSSIDDTKLQSLSSTYLEFEEETKFNFIFTGMTEFTGQNDTPVKACKLVDKDGKQWINGNMLLVKHLENVTQLPCYVRIITGTTKKSGSGNSYLQMDVYVLPQTVKK